MLKELAELFEDIDLVWCDNPGKEIHKSENYEKLIAIFPNLQKIHQKWVKNDLFEFNRTMRHVFRLFKIYFLLKQDKFGYEYLSNDSIQDIRKKIGQFSSYEMYIPILLMYHDIGRLIDRKTHAYHSSNLILKQSFLDSFDIPDMDKLFLRKLIEYHLLLATIYTGESTFFGIVSLLNDKEIIKLVSHQNKNYVEHFVDLLEIFTYLDILGYPYSRIFDHYLKYYSQISEKLKKMLKLGLKNAISLAKDYSLEWTDWRLAGALRIFQFVETKPYLTEDFYFTVLKRSLHPECERHGLSFDWNLIKSKFLSHIYKFQLKYALPLLMLLAFGEFKRFRLKENQNISPKLLLFWILLSNEVVKRKLNDEEVVWNIYFENIPFWSEIKKAFIEKLEVNNLKTVISSALLKFDKNKCEYNLYLDFDELNK